MYIVAPPFAPSFAPSIAPSLAPPVNSVTYRSLLPIKGM